ncbi:nuclear transport factor 2 family protein [Aureisphaera galaxeae]|uniref:nuclear transport factor 2 family protein n=1 Tax=Aureisphaera galaxeae TaxID=1538023 RepID=UPI002350BE5C|nr:nuclear transport factor 2 family protein [Aureisphaera galaxeae]MDC8002658.1 nuclear transport factor 2 family protein [Aureisphaera galaxeae]
MRKYLFALVFLLSGSLLWAQDGSLLELFQSQIKAFNTQDVDALVNNVSEDFKYFYITKDELVLEVVGKEAFRNAMEQYFGSGIKVTSEISEYVVQGSIISFKETVSYLNKEGKKVQSSSMGAYQIKDGKITRSWYFIE